MHLKLTFVEGQRVLQIPLLYPMIQLPVLNSFHAVDTTELILSVKKDVKGWRFSQLI